MHEKECFISSVEFLGALRRLELSSPTGKLLASKTSFSWKKPPYFHEEVLLYVWVGSVETMTKEKASLLSPQMRIGRTLFSQEIRDIASLFFFISAPFAERVIPERVKKPLLTYNLRQSIFFDANRFLAPGFLSYESFSLISERAEYYLMILKKEGVFGLTENGLALAKREIEKELREKNKYPFRF